MLLISTHLFTFKLTSSRTLTRLWQVKGQLVRPAIASCILGDICCIFRDNGSFLTAWSGFSFSNFKLQFRSNVCIIYDFLL